ncbi:MAG: iron-sulfur cluster co-chaperone HscB C-terminal domain-containing protein [Planctomycetota bacterium]
MGKTEEQGPVESPLFCARTKRLLEARGNLTPFEVLGLTPSYPLDDGALRRRLLRLSRQVHPDFHGQDDPATRELAERNMAELNTAFRILSDDFRRADWLVRSLGGPSEDQDREMPPEFLLEVFEWNEALEEARAAGVGSPARARLAAQEEALVRERRRAMDEVGAMLTPLPPAGSAALADIRRRLNSVRYLNRTLQEIAEIRLEEPAG